MGFFKDLANDNVDGVDNTEVSGEKSELDKIFDLSGFGTSEPADEAAEEEPAAGETVFEEHQEEPEQVDEALLENLFDPSDSTEDIVVEDEPEAEAVEEITSAADEEFETKADDSEQVTVITKGTTINGSIVSDCSLNVMGTINGDIECIGKLTISGSVVGNSVASDVFVNTKRLDGNIDSDGTVKIGLGTVVVGDIKAGSAVIAGAVKGELDVKGPVIIDSTAIIKGNIKAKSVQMNNGAVIEGFCSLVYAEVDIDDIFE